MIREDWRTSPTKTGWESCGWRKEMFGENTWRREGSFNVRRDLTIETERLSTRSRNDRKKDNGFKLNKSWFKLNIRKKISMMRVGRQWNKLPEEAVDAHPSGIFEARLGRVLWATRTRVKHPRLRQAHWNWMVFKGPLQIKPFYDSTTV